MGLVDVTSRYRFRAAGLSMVVMPERRMSACVPFDRRKEKNNTTGRGLPISERSGLQLSWLGLAGNRIVRLNDRVGALHKELKEIWLLDNAGLEHPSRAVLDKGTAAVLWDCRDRQLRRLHGAPPPPTLRSGQGILGERVVPEGRLHLDLARRASARKRRASSSCTLWGFALPERVLTLTRLRELRVSGHEGLVEVPALLSRLALLEMLCLAANGQLTKMRTARQKVPGLLRPVGALGRKTIRRLPAGLLGAPFRGRARPCSGRASSSPHFRVVRATTAIPYPSAA